MSLDDSIASIMKRLNEWSQLPKYQLERRIDIFLTPFLESFLTSELRNSSSLVVPEFPLLSELRDLGPTADASGLSCRTVNVDYLIRVGPTAPCWLFLELKTDGGSFDKEQADLYAKAKTRGMAHLVKDLALVMSRTEKRHRSRYEKLLRLLPSPEAPHQHPIEVAYLAPSEIGPLVEGRGFRFFSLESFAEQDAARIPAEHQELWPHVRDLVRSLSRKESASARRSGCPTIE